MICFPGRHLSATGQTEAGRAGAGSLLRSRGPWGSATVEGGDAPAPPGQAFPFWSLPSASDCSQPGLLAVTTAGGRGGSRGAGAAPLGGYRTDLAWEKDRALCASLGGKGVLLSRRPYGPGRSAEAQRGLPGGDRGASFRGTRDAQCWARCYSLSLTCRTTLERALSAPTGVRGARRGRKSINVPVAAVSQARGWLGTRPTRPISLDLGGDPWAAPVSRARGPEIWSATGRAA